MILSPRDTPGHGIAPAYQLRPLVARRISRLRVSWFVLGTLFGAAVGISAAKLTSGPTAYAPAKASLATEARPVAPIAAADPKPAMPTPQLAAPAVELPKASAAVVRIPFPVKPALQLPATVNLTVQKKETLASILMNKGVSHEETLAALESLKTEYNPKRITRGQAMILKLDPDVTSPNKAVLSSLSIEESPLRTVTLTRSVNGTFAARGIQAPIFKGLAHAGGTIHSSLYQTAIDSGIPVKMVSEIIQAFSYDVDFQRDIHSGDKLDVVFERTHNDKNVTTSVGQMQYASLILDGEAYTVYRYTGVDGFTGYYNAKGESVRKALLKTPINGAHVTSSFGMRMHPLLGYSKMHKGIDFGAPTGTPIYAAGDGVIEEADRKGGYGNYVRLRHNATYATAYGHASRIAKGIHPGVHVRQGQIIAYVGSTGQSTGPHLHYEILSGGTQINPSGVKFRTGQTLGGKDYAAFKKQVKQVETALVATPHKTQVASIR